MLHKRKNAFATVNTILLTIIALFFTNGIYCANLNNFIKHQHENDHCISTVLQRYSTANSFIYYSETTSNYLFINIDNLPVSIYKNSIYKRFGDLETLIESLHINRNIMKKHIFFINALHELQEILFELKLIPLWKPGDVTIVTNISKIVYVDIFELLWTYDIYSVMVLNSATGFVYTAHPFQNCKGDVTNINEFSCDDTAINVDYKIEHGCDISLIITESMYSFPYTDNVQTSRNPGVLMYPMMLLAEKYNFKLVYVKVAADEKNKSVICNSPDTRFLFDITGLQAIESKCGSLSKHFYVNAYYWVVLKPVADLKKFSFLGFIFPFYIWILIGAVHLFCTFLYFCLWYNSKLSLLDRIFNSFLELFAILLAISVNGKWKSASTRLYILFFIIYTMNVNYLFQVRFS